MMAKDSKLLVEISGLTWGYPRSPSFVFDKFNYQLFKNDFCVILGKSGIGKTTLVKFLMGQLQPPKKMIFYKKEDVARFTDTEIQKYRRKIGVIHQDYKLIDWKTVAENIIYPLQVAGEDPEKIKRKLDEILFSMDLLDKKDNMVTTLSGGEKQRVAIARALISNPEFIIADEPTGNLDTETSQKIVDILIESNQKGNTVVVITHDLALLEYMRQKHQIKVVQL